MVRMVLACCGFSDAACGHWASLVRADAAANGEAASSLSYEGWLEVEVGTVTGSVHANAAFGAGHLVELTS